MNRILSLILCGVLCLGLCACGNSNSGSDYRGEHSRLLAMLDEHNYRGAVDYINNLAEEYAQQGNDGATEEYVYTAAMPGEWVAYDAKDGVQVPKVVFNADGTCTIGDDQYRWSVEDEGQTQLNVAVLKGAEKVHTVSFSKSGTDGKITMSSRSVVKDTYLNFYNPAHYDLVEITKDNWADYFDDSANEFGEVTTLHANRQWKLSASNYSRLWINQSNVAVEYSYSLGRQYAQWDLSAQTCSLSDVFEPNVMDGDNAQVDTQMEKMSSWSDDSTEAEGDSYYGYRIMCCEGVEDQETGNYFRNYKVNVRLVRAQGTLWLVKESIKNLQKTEN